MRSLSLLCLAAVLALTGSTNAALVSFVTPPGATEPFTGLPVDASATFSTGPDLVLVTLSNLIVNERSVAQNVSDIAFTLDTGQTSGSITSSSGLERTVHADKTYTDGSVVAAGWKIGTLTLGSTTYIHLTVLGGAPATPSHTILGQPTPPGNTTYANANTSIAGNGPHNPFLYGPVSFTLAVAGVTAASVVNDAVFSFGTTPGQYVHGVPLPSAALLGGIALLGLAGLRINRRRRME